MKEITRIHLAATPYNIDVTAKKELEKYINAITRALGADDDALREIEARMVELLIERDVTGEKVITPADVDAIKERLGEPGDFADGESTPEYAGKPSKKLMRDTENGMIAGVLSGFAAYTGVDVIWWRIATVLLVFVSFGTVVLVYIVLCIVIPKARTAADRLQMRGELPSLENIHEEANRDVVETPVQNKPLVVTLRVLAILTLIGMVMGVVGLMAFGMFGVGSLWHAYNWLANGWLLLAAGMGIVSGVLFAALVTLGIYGMWAWKATRKMAIVATSIVVAGLLLFGAAIGTGFYGANIMQASIKDHTQTYQVPLDGLARAKNLHVAATGTPIEYHVTTEAPYAEVETLQRDAKKLPLTVNEKDGIVTLQVGSVPAQDCQNIFNACNVESARVKVYGPALDVVTIADASLQYHGKEQATLRMELGKESVASLRGRVETLDVKLAEYARFQGDNAAITAANVTVDQMTSADFGTMKTLNITAPESCGGDNDISYELADTVTVNGQPATSATLKCVDIDADEFDKENL